MKLHLASALQVAALLLPALATAQVATPAWRTGFENGFPGEYPYQTDSSFTPDGTPNPGRANAWTIVDSTDPSVYVGGHSYRGWPIAWQSYPHSPNPKLHTDIATPLVNSFMVWLNVDYSQLSSTEWVGLASWGNNPNWIVHSMQVRERQLRLFNTDGTYIGPEPQPDFPLRQWVRLTAYIHYQGAQGEVRIWQDGVPVLEGTYTGYSGTSLMRAHWGWYSSGSVTQGVQYNDEIQIWTLSEPLTDLDTEPATPYEPDTPGGGGPGGGAAAGGGGVGGSAAGGGVGAAAGLGGVAGTAPSVDADDESGCGCAAVGQRRAHHLWLLALAAAAVARRRQNSALRPDRSAC